MKNWYRILILFLVSSSLLTFTAAAQQKNTDTERALVLKLAAYLKDSSYIKNTIRQIETEKKVETQITGYQKLHKQVQRMLLLQSELKWLNMEAIRLAYEDMKRIEGFDAVKYLPILTELEQQVKQGFGNIYSGDEAVLVNAEKAVAVINWETGIVGQWLPNWVRSRTTGVIRNQPAGKVLTPILLS